MRPPTSGLDVVIDRNRHSRSNSDRILNLLNDKDPGPALTKARKPEIHQPPPQMDHFYIAKLLLHGLKPLKSKQAATKKALLAALQWVAGLTVPETILKFERDLAAERLQRRSIRSRNRFERGQKRKKERSARGTDEDDLLADVQAPRQRGIQVDQGTAPGVSLLGRVLVPREISMLITSPPQVSKRLDISDLSGAFHIAAPAFSSDWDCLTPKSAFFSTSKHVWGAFDFGAFEAKLTVLFIACHACK